MNTHRRHASQRGQLAWLILLGLLLLSVPACTRKFYRQRADEDAYCLVDNASTDPRWTLDDYTIQPDCRSRMFYPFNPDFPPMPPDDPTSHQLMRCVDGKHGSALWKRYGCTSTIENPNWAAYLPFDPEQNVLLDRQSVVELGLINSRDYQHELEDLYLSALDVSFERFQFDVQFFGGNTTFFTADGPVRGGGNSSSRLDVDTTGQARLLLASGGELVAGVANSMVWQFAGPDTHSTFTILDFSLVQPLLRAGTRAVVLENLTESERALLANIRQMERFRRGFYAQLITGRSPGGGPNVAGIALSAAAGGGSTPSGGLLGILEEQVRIRNRQANVAALRDSMDRLQAFFEAGLLENSYQVDLARQRLLNEQSGLLSDIAAYESRLDAYKITLGLPPDLKVRAYDHLLERFDLISPAMTATQNDVTAVLEYLRDPERPLPSDYPQQLKSIVSECLQQTAVVRSDLAQLEAALPARRANLRKLAARQRLANEEIEGVGNVESLNERAARVVHDFAHLSEQLNFTLADLDPLLPVEGEVPEAADVATRRDQLTRWATTLSSQMLRLSLIQARARLDTVYLVPIQLEAERAFDIARQNRRDWMNARAALVDQWRQIQIAANDLRSDLDVTLSGDLGTVGNNPVKFRGTNGRLRVGLAFDAPLTRLAERNAYRATLIQYDRSRREYYAYEDEVQQSLRNSIRSIRLGQLNFEVRRAAVFVAITRVDVARLNLERAPKTGASLTVGANAARDLVDALSDLLNEQNNFLSVWVDYEAQRIGLDFDLGTMRLDSRGMWIDPGEIGPEGPSYLTTSEEPIEEIPAIEAPAGFAPATEDDLEDIDAPPPPALPEPPPTP